MYMLLSTLIYPRAHPCSCDHFLTPYPLTDTHSHQEEHSNEGQVIDKARTDHSNIYPMFVCVCVRFASARKKQALFLMQVYKHGRTKVVTMLQASDQATLEITDRERWRCVYFVKMATHNPYACRRPRISATRNQIVSYLCHNPPCFAPSGCP